MGYAHCRFLDCGATGNGDYEVYLSDLNIVLAAPQMWRHYMDAHMVYPNSEERNVVMTTDPAQAGILYPGMRSKNPRYVGILYVERTEKGLTHIVGIRDPAFMEKLETLLEKGKFALTKGI